MDIGCIVDIVDIGDIGSIEGIVGIGDIGGIRGIGGIGIITDMCNLFLIPFSYLSSTPPLYLIQENVPFLNAEMVGKTVDTLKQQLVIGEEFMRQNNRIKDELRQNNRIKDELRQKKANKL